MSNHKSIFKTSIITGGSQLIVMIFNLIRAKVLAIFLGPEGTGMIGLLTSTTDLINSISSLGIHSSAIREIALANKEDDKDKLRKVLFVFRWLIRVTGAIGATFLFLFSDFFSVKAFGNVNYSQHFKWLSLIILISSFTAGQHGLLQGLRKIKELAFAKILGAFSGTILSISLIYIFGKDGILPFIIFGSFTTLLTSWYFTRKQGLKSLVVPFEEFTQQSARLLKLGFAFLISSLTISISAYVSRIYIADLFSIEIIGVYTACWTLSSIYINFILSAMSADFYPRLTEVIDDQPAASTLINHQTEIGILMALCGIIAVITFSDLILEVFYSDHFIVGSSLLKWMTIGMTIKIIIWPVGYILVAKAKMKTFVLLEISWGVLYITTLYFFTRFWGLIGVGISFFTTYLINSILVYWFSKRSLSFHWKSNTLKLILISFLFISIAFCSSIFLEKHWSYFIGTLILITSIIFVYYQLTILLNYKPIMKLKQKFLKNKK